MGCLNPDQGFSHWFANIHLSGPCNRSCYFCIGQHMMALDALDNLDSWPLAGLDEFVRRCRARGVREVNVTGTNTEPLLYRHLPELRAALERELGPGLVFGARSNGVLVERRPELWRLFDKASVTLCSADPQIYRQMMGQGAPPRIDEIVSLSGHMRSLKVNVVLGPENTRDGDIYRTLDYLAECGIRRVNLREPYGQPHVGDPLAGHARADYLERRLGMPIYAWREMEVCYWDVHYVEVESINLYASGRVSETYPITKGHHPTGEVRSQEHFPGGRVAEQWLGRARRRAARG